jgi:putative membrane protein
LILLLLLAGHVLALAFGLAGMLIALPNPQLWAGSPLGRQVYLFGMQYATTISLGSELLGTGTGWPFGAYEYTDGLGAKVLGRVPYTIPLSWFYIGFASYLLAHSLQARMTLRLPAWATVGLGAWLLLCWDLVLDPAMAHESLPLKFWIWHESGPYFGMPIKNLAAWFLTGLVYIGLSRWLWGSEPGPTPPAVPLATYLANLVFAAVLSASVGLWQPIPLAIALAAAPLALLLVPITDRREVHPRQLTST